MANRKLSEIRIKVLKRFEDDTANPTNIANNKEFNCTRPNIIKHCNALKDLGFLEHHNYKYFLTREGKLLINSINQELSEGNGEPLVSWTTHKGSGDTSTDTNMQKYPEDHIRHHNSRFTLSIKDSKWINTDFRRKILTKNSIPFQKISGIGYEAEQLTYEGRTIQFYPKSIVFYMTNPNVGYYFAQDAVLAYRKALISMFDLVLKIEEMYQLSFKGMRGYKVKPSKGEYGIIKNALAKQYNTDKEKLYVIDETGNWLIIDKSLYGDELETVGKNSKMNNLTVHDFWNSVKKNPITVDQLLEMQKNSMILHNQATIEQKEIRENLNYYAKHAKAHTDLLIKLEKRFDDIISRLK